MLLDMFDSFQTDNNVKALGSRQGDLGGVSG